jgi:hypothetical protein
MDFVNVIGILGFILSVVVFALTRWERRKILTIDLECVSGELTDKFKEEAGEFIETMLVIRVMNTGPRAIAIDKTSIKVIGPKKNVNTYDTDWFGLDRIPHPLSPNEHFEVGIFLETFTLFQDYKGFSTDVIPISIELKDIENKLYTLSSRYELLLEVDDVRRLP